MSKAPDSSQPDRAHGLAFIAWCGFCVALVALGASGPRLWATQSVATPRLAMQIMALGQTLGWILFLPTLGRLPVAARAGIVSSVPAWIFLAAGLGGASLGAACETAGRVVLVLVVSSTIWAAGRRRRLFGSLCHTILLAWAVGLPALAFLAADYGQAAGRLLHFSAAWQVATTFSH